MASPGFWDMQENAQKVVQELKLLRAGAEPVQDVLRRVDDAAVLLELANEANDAAALAELQRELDTIAAKTDRVELTTLLSGKNDHLPCFFSIQAGAGGVESCDFAEMLLRMYLM